MTNLISEHIDIWTKAQKNKATTGRGSSSKVELYGVAKLRELILDLAVRGKLVHQDSNDEAASKILIKIKEKNEKLVKEKKIRKAKLAKDIEMPDVIYDSPNGWSLTLLADLLVNPSDDIVDGPFGSKLKASEYVDEGIPIIRIQNIDRNNFKKNGIQYLTEKKAEELERHNFISGDIILNKLGEPAGKTCIVPDEIESGIIVADIIRIRIDESLHNKQYLVYCLNSPMIALQFSSLAKGVTRQRVNLSQVRSLKVPLPPFPEQQRIVARVDELMALCDQLEQEELESQATHQTLVKTLLNTLTNVESAEEFTQNWQRIADSFDVIFTTEESIEELKQTILQLAVMGKLVPQDPSDEPANELLKKIEEEKERLVKEKKIKKQKTLSPISNDEKLFDLPQNWKWCRLQELVTLLGDGLHGTPTYNEMGTYYFINGNNLNSGLIQIKHDTKKVDEDEYLKHKKELNDRTVLVSINGTLGNVAFYDNEPVMLGKSACYFNLSTGLSKLFFQRLIESPHFLEYAYENATGSTIKNLGLKAMNNFVVALPSENEQQRIVEKVDELMALCDTLKSKISNAKDSQVLLADAIAGQAV